MRFPGVSLGVREKPFSPLLQMVADRVKVPVESWSEYGHRAETRREHALELQAIFGLKPFTMRHYRSGVRSLEDIAWQTDKGIVLTSALIEEYRRQKVLLPSLNNIERICAEAVTRANRRIYAALTGSLTDVHRVRLDALLRRTDNSNTTLLAWLRQSPARPNSRHMIEHIERLRALQALDLPNGIERQIHQNRLLKIAREGGQMTPADLAKFEPQRRYATLVAVAVEGTATVTHEIIDLHDRNVGKMFNPAKHKHQEQFQTSGKAINDKVRLYGRVGQALIEAKRLGADPFAAIESVLPWEAFASSVNEAQNLAQPEDFDFLHRIGESYATLRRYAPEFLEELKFRAAPAAEGVLEAIGMLRGMNAENARKIPADAPIAFIKKRWEKLVFTEGGVDRRYYELCAMSDLKNALRSGDVWVEGSRQHKDFDEYLVPAEKFITLKTAGKLPLSVATGCEEYLHKRLSLLEQQLETVNILASANQLPDASITDAGLKITPLDAAVPEAAQQLIDQTATMLPHIKITELLLEVDAWTGFTGHFTHLKTGELARDKSLLLTAILADAINLGLSKMAESCRVPHTQGCPGCRPGTSATRPIRKLWPSWSMSRPVTRSPHTGATAQPRPPTGSASRWEAKPRAPATSTRNTARSRDERPTPTSPISSHRNTQRPSTWVSVMPPTCSMVCSITSPTCASRSTTLTRLASPITSLPSCICWAFGSRRGCAIWGRPDSTCQSVPRHTPPSNP